MTARILVVDDIPANVKLLEARLVAEYFDVLTAADGYEALAICEKQPLDLILRFDAPVGGKFPAIGQGADQGRIGPIIGTRGGGIE